ncbi:MAG: orotidine-5'-phosphate decarboxylase [Actinomycetota bacterium]|nr:orotidine-5'-phosphate decarboxylase [Actinomycetota bacterium]
MTVTASVSRDRVALALDTDDLVEAVRVGARLRPWFGVAKIGLELYSAAGPDAIGHLADLGYRVFVDLKIHDMPEVAHSAGRVLGSLGATYVTFHARGGVAMLSAGVEGLRAGAGDAGLDAPVPLAVTVLLSDGHAPPHLVPERVVAAAEAGCGGIVCAADDLATIAEVAPRLIRVVPGIRAEGPPHVDQPRAVTPRAALGAGADLIVIGRAVTSAPDPEVAANALLGDVVAPRVAPVGGLAGGSSR